MYQYIIITCAGLNIYASMVSDGTKMQIFFCVYTIYEHKKCKWIFIETKAKSIYPPENLNITKKHTHILHPN